MSDHMAEVMDAGQQQPPSEGAEAVCGEIETASAPSEENTRLLENGPDNAEAIISAENLEKHGDVLGDAEAISKGDDILTELKTESKGYGVCRETTNNGALETVTENKLVRDGDNERAMSPTKDEPPEKEETFTKDKSETADSLITENTVTSDDMHTATVQVAGDDVSADAAPCTVKEPDVLKEPGIADLPDDMDTTERSSSEVETASNRLTGTAAEDGPLPPPDPGPVETPPTLEKSAAEGTDGRDHQSATASVSSLVIADDSSSSSSHAASANTGEAPTGGPTIHLEDSTSVGGAPIPPEQANSNSTTPSKNHVSKFTEGASSPGEEVQTPTISNSTSLLVENTNPEDDGSAPASKTTSIPEKDISAPEEETTHTVAEEATPNKDSATGEDPPGSSGKVAPTPPAETISTSGDHAASTPAPGDGARSRVTRSRNPDFSAKQRSFMKEYQRSVSRGGGSAAVLGTVEGEKRSGSEEPATPPTGKRRRVAETSDTTAPSTETWCSEDVFCWVCHRDGDVVRCGVCPRAFHRKCAGLAAAATVAADWSCAECRRGERTAPALRQLSRSRLTQLMQFAIGRLKGLPGAEPFIQPVDERKFPAYREVVAVPMDLTTMEAQLSRGAYTSTAAFVADCKWILHNCILFNGTGNKLTTLAKSLLRMCKWEMEEIETCPDCYGNAYSSDNWFTAACPYPHLLIWARLKGFPFWPAKAMKTRDGNVDCRFFGRHDRAWVPAKECFLFSKDPPAPPKSRSKSLDACVEELRDHVKNLEKRFGKYVYARNKTQYDPNRLPAQLKMTIPGYHEPSPDSGPVTGKRPGGAAPERARDGKRARVSAASEESEDLGAAAGPAAESAPSSSAQTTVSRAGSSGRSGRTSAASSEKPDTRAEPDVGAEPDAGGKLDTGEKVESVEKAAPSGKPDLNGALDVSLEAASSVEPDTCVKPAPKAKPDTSVKAAPKAKPDTSVKTALRGKPDTSEKTVQRPKPDDTQESQKPDANNERAADTERQVSAEQPVSGQKLAAAMGSAKSKDIASADKSVKTVKSPSVEKSVTGIKPASVVRSNSGTEASKRRPVVVKKLGTLDAAVSVENCSDGGKTSLSPSVETPDGTERVMRVEKTGRGERLGSGRKEVASDKKTGKKADTINTDKACKVQKKEEPKTITLSAKAIKKEPCDADSSNSEAAGTTPVSSSSIVAVQAAGAAQSRTSKGPSWSSRRKTARKSLAGAAISSVAARLSGNRAAAAEPPSKPSPSGPPEKPSTVAAKPAAAARRSSGSHTVVIPVSAAVSTASTTIVVGPQARSAASRPPQPSTSVVVVSRDPAASSPTTVRLSAPAQVSAQPLRPKIWTSSAISAVPASSATRAPAPSSATSPPVVVSRRDGARLMIPRSGLYIPAGPQQSAPVMVIPSGVQNGVVTLPSAEVGPVSGEVDRQASSLTELLREGVERYLQDRASAGDWRATNTNLELAMEKREWKHKAEISELNRRHEAQLAEVRSAAELEQKRAVNRLAMAHSAERREWERQTEQKIAETKRKQWCAACGKEAIFYCCWNTSYCDFPCQEAQWPKHMLTCANQQGGHVGDGDGRLG